MKTLMLVSVISLAGCAHTASSGCVDYSKMDPGYYGGDGSSELQAVAAVGDTYPAYRWIEERRPGSRVTTQKLVISERTKQRYELITYELADGRQEQAWFLVVDGMRCLRQ